jgi:hypothetical protein
MSDPGDVLPHATREAAEQRTRLAPGPAESFQAFSKSVFADGAIPASSEVAARAAGIALAGPSRFDVGRLFIISASVSKLVSLSMPSGNVSSDCCPPPGRGAFPSPRRTFTCRETSASGLP